MQRRNRLDRERREDAERFLAQSAALKKEDDLKQLNAAFSSEDANLDSKFKSDTIGLLSASEFKQKRAEIDALRLEAERRLRKEERSRAKKRHKVNALSFYDEECIDEVVPEDEAAIVSDCRIVKDPTVDTSFLRDNAREAQEKMMRAKFEREWKETQEKVKKEKLEIVYSYWDGSGNRRSCQVDKGFRIDQFLEVARKQLSKDFSALRGASSENLMYIKEDLIIPHHFTFYDLQLTKARGKSGPLFHFDVHDDVRLLADASVEKDESHAGKIITRSWYERNKHVFPCCRWEIYDPKKTYDKYTIG